MTNTQPKDGDFASYIVHLTNRTESSGADRSHESTAPQAVLRQFEQTHQGPESELTAEDQAEVNELVMRSSGRSIEFLNELAELQELPPPTEDELMRQAIEHPGVDGDPSTPE